MEIQSKYFKNNELLDLIQFTWTPPIDTEINKRVYLIDENLDNFPINKQNEFIYQLIQLSKKMNFDSLDLNDLFLENLISKDFNFESLASVNKFYEVLVDKQEINELNSIAKENNWTTFEAFINNLNFQQVKDLLDSYENDIKISGLRSNKRLPFKLIDELLNLNDSDFVILMPSNFAILKFAKTHKKSIYSFDETLFFYKEFVLKEILKNKNSSN
ncbi:hypothetical protein [Mycoplasma mycoides]|uniref:hypothetical protein n=1 Tax=Mycoplasma mycoides TaxID=2102 RepID=UPI00224088AA|nr:hypothetical protein [Mycoplasma mycoides]QVJ96040.1 hypothetical protein I7632_03340 [Mycoplasma mycoides subsp. capri]QVJ96935.1 hypothetical protein I7633_03295 [Mycoplasma mycoides subsp. capri]QVK00798.1 hypothetical protein I7635_03290 [Mycoplasma mycoides subsp. capri]